MSNVIDLIKLELGVLAVKYGDLELHHGVADRDAVISGDDGRPLDHIYARVNDVDFGVLVVTALRALPALLRLARAAKEAMDSGIEHRTSEPQHCPECRLREVLSAFCFGD